MGSPRLRIARRELASLRSEKTIVLALGIQLFVAAFSSFLVVGLVSMYDPGSASGFDVEVAIAGDETDVLGAVVARTGGIRGTRYPTREAALQGFAQGRVDAVILTERLDDGTVRADVTAPEGTFATTLVVVAVQDVMERYETALRDRRADRLEAELVPVPPETKSSPYFGFTYTVLVPLLLFLPAFIGGSIAVDTLAEEVERGTLELLRVSPASLAAIVDGKLLAAAGPVPLQVGLWFGLLELNGTHVRHVPELLVFAAAVGAAVGAIGLGVAAATRDRRLAQFLYSSGVLVLFGGTMLLPEDPANVVARFAVGSPGVGTYASLAGTVVLAAATVLAVRAGVARMNVDDL